MQKLLLLVGLCVLVAHFEATDSRNLVCTFQRDSNFDMATHMEPLLCTHIIFKSVQPNNAMAIPSSGGPIQDHQSFKTEFPSATTKTLLEVDLTQTSSAMDNQFIQSVIDVVVAADFDGVNILWMKSGSSNPADKQGFTSLMKELRAKMEEEPGNRLLTASVSGVPSVIDDSYEVAELVAVVDFFNVMTADLDQTISDTDAAGAASSFPNADAGMQKWVAKGAPRAKLNMGIATYGVDTNPGAAQKIWPKSQECTDTSLPNTVHVDSDATIDAKAQHIKDQNFGGAFVTSLELDDFAGGACVPGTYPVIHRIKNII